MQPSPEISHWIKLTSPKKMKEQGNRVYTSKPINGYLSLGELRRALYMLAEAHLLTPIYIANNAAGNAQDATRELFNAVRHGIFIESSPGAPTMKVYYVVNPNADSTIVSEWLNPSRKTNPRIKKYSTVVKPRRDYPRKPRKSAKKPDPRGESNRIANYKKPIGGETLTGTGTPDTKPSKDNYNWSDKTSKQFGRELHNGKIQQQYEKYF